MTSKIIELEMDAHGDMKDITPEIQKFVQESEKKDGAVLVFVIGSTGAVTTIEFEPGLRKDFPRIMDKIAPYGDYYEHHKTWHDDNGSSHVKASIVGPSIVVPFINKKLMLGTWQQVVVINFDTRPRKRKVLLQII